MRTLPTWRRNSSGIVASASAAIASKSSRVGAVPKQGVRRGFVKTGMTLAFVLTRLSGDLAISIAGPNATQADVEAVRKAYGLDRPLLVQFFDWVGRASLGDLGESFFFKTPVAKLIG